MKVERPVESNESLLTDLILGLITDVLEDGGAEAIVEQAEYEYDLNTVDWNALESAVRQRIPTIANDLISEIKRVKENKR